VLSAEAAGALDKCAYLPGRQSQRSGDRLSACVAFGWRWELTRFHGLAAVLDDLRSTVRLVLVNSSRAWSSWTKHERLIDPDDVGAGHIVRFRRANPDQIVRSQEPAHPAIVTVYDFVDVQLLRRFRGASGPQKLERGPRPTKQPYLFRGRIRCGFCLRRMEGSTRQTRTYYRCAARSIVPGAPALAHHPKNVYLPEAALVGPLNEWLAQLFNEDNLDRTVANPYSFPEH
jgi:Recombinase zinc beta ribbon domain